MEDTDALISVASARTPDEDGSEVIELTMSFTPASIVREVRLRGVVVPIQRSSDGASGMVTLVGASARQYMATDLPLAIRPRLFFGGSFTVQFAVRSIEQATSESLRTTVDVGVQVNEVANPPVITLASNAQLRVNQGAVVDLALSQLALVDQDGSERLSLALLDASSALTRVESIQTNTVLRLTAVTQGANTVRAFALDAVPDDVSAGARLLTLRLTASTSWFGTTSLVLVATSTEKISLRTATSQQTATLTVLPIADRPVVSLVPTTRERLSEWAKVGISTVSLADPAKSNVTALVMHLVPRITSPATRLRVRVQGTDVTPRVVPTVGNGAPAYTIPLSAAASVAVGEVLVSAVDAIGTVPIDVITVATVSVSSTTQRDTQTVTITYVAVVLSASTFALKEVERGTMTARLVSAPLAPLTLSFSSSNEQKAVMQPSTLSFSPTDWDAPRQLRVQPIDNALEDADAAVVLRPTITTTDELYAAVSLSDIAVQVVNDDVSSVVAYQKVVTTAPVLVVAEGRVFSDAYSIVLTAQPRADVTVTLTSSLTQLVVAPTTLTFTPTNWNVAVTVAVDADDNQIREFDHFGEIRHAVASADALYNGKAMAALRVKIVETKDTTPPPKMVSVRFTNTAVGLIITFDRPVYRKNNPALVNDNFDCSQLFDLAPASSTTGYLGQSPTCTWQNNDLSIRLVFGLGATVVPGASLPLKGGILKSTFEAELATTATTATIVAPAVVPQPVVVVTGARSLGTCDNLFLDGSGSSGSGGRAMTFRWLLVDSNTAAATSLDNFIALLSQASAANSPTLNIAAASLEPDGQYSIVLQVRNFFGAETNSAVIPIVKASLPLPIVAIRGGSKQVFLRARNLSVTATADRPTCSGSSGDSNSSTTGDMTFTWRQREGDLPVGPIRSSSLNPRVLRILARTLNVGVKYVFELEVAMRQNPRIRNTASVEVSVLASELSAVIAGGDRSSGVEQDFVLDASRSQDPDDPSNTIPMNYTWSCMMSSTGATGPFDKACLAADGSAFTIPNALQARATIPANTLNPNIFFQFTVTIAKDTRKSSASVTIFFVPGSPPTVSIEPLSVSKVNVNDRVVLRGTVTSKLPIRRTEWSLVGGTDAQEAAMFTVSKSGRRTMVLRENSLTPGITYQFQLLAEDSAGATAAATIAVAANAPPTSGSLTVTPSSGHALDDTFTVQCSNWVDEDLPLRYTYRFIKGSAFSGGAEATLGSASLDPLFKSIFSAGGGDNATITVVAYIQDALGATTRVFREIVVQEKVIKPEEQAAYLAEKASDVLASVSSGDPSKVLNVISALGDMLNGVDESTLVVPTPAPPPGADPAPEVKLKRCPTASLRQCNSKGECVRDPPECLETNLACITYCKCSEGFYGDNCGMDQAEFDAKRAVLSSLITAMATSVTAIDVTDVAAMEQQASSIATLTKSASILDASAQAVAMNFVDNIMNAPVLSASAKQAVGATISNLLDADGSSSSTDEQTTTSRRLNTVSSSSASGQADVSVGTNGSNQTDPFQKQKQRLAKLQGTIGKLETALLASSIAGEEPVTMVSKNLKIVGQRERVSNLEGREVALPLTDAERAANFTPPSTTIPTGFAAYVKAQVAARRRARRLSEYEDDPVVDVQSTVFTRNPYAFTGAAVNSPVMSVKVKQDGEDVHVEGLQTPFRILLRNIVAVAPLVNGTNGTASSTRAPQTFGFYCVNGTVDTKHFFCTELNDTISVTCTGKAEYEGNITCPVRKATPACRYWNAQNSSWASDGCEAVGTTPDGLYTICECTHLTDFSTQVEEAFSLVTQHFRNVLSHKVTLEDLKKNIVLVLVLLAFDIAFLVAFFYVSRWDYHDRLAHLRQKRLAIEEPKHIKLSSPFQEPEFLHAKDWRAKCRVVLRSWWSGIKENHKLASIAFKYDEHFSRKQRITVIFTTTMSQMFINALLYKLRQGPKTIGSAVVSGVVSFVCMIPVTIAFVLMFKKAGRQQKYLIRYRVEDDEGNIAEVQTDAYGKAKAYTPAELMAMDLVAIANCIEARRLQRVAEEIKRQGLTSRAAQICRGVFLALYNRDADEPPPENGQQNDEEDPLRSVIVHIKSHLERQQATPEAARTASRSKSIFGSRQSRHSRIASEKPPTLVEEREGDDANERQPQPLQPTLSDEERRALAMNQLLLMLGQGGGESVHANLLKFDPLLVSSSSADKIRAICERYDPSRDAADDLAERAWDNDDDEEAEDVLDVVQTLQDWLAKCSECCQAAQSNTHVIVEKAQRELERTETQLKKLRHAIGNQFEKRISEVLFMAESMGGAAMNANAEMVQRATDSVQAARRRTAARLRRKTRASSHVAADGPVQDDVTRDRRVTLTIKQQKKAILRENQQRLRERRRTVKEARRIATQERKRLQREAKKEMHKLVEGLRGVTKMKKKLELYAKAKEDRRLELLPLHERKLYLIEKERLQKLKRTSRVLYNQFLRRQPAKVNKPMFPEWVVYISYAICAGWCAWSTFFVLMFGFSIGGAESSLWISSLFTGLAMTYVVSDPMKIFFRMGVMPLVATTVLAEAGLFGTLDAGAIAIGAIAAVGTSGVAKLMAKQSSDAAERKNERRLRSMKTSNRIAVDQDVNAQALAIVAREMAERGDTIPEAEQEEEEEGAAAAEEEEARERETLPVAPRAGEFTDLVKPTLDAEYAARRAALEAELKAEEDAAAAKRQAEAAAAAELPKLHVTKGPPVQQIRPPNAIETDAPALQPSDDAAAAPDSTLAQRSSEVLRSHPVASVFGPDEHARKPPKVGTTATIASAPGASVAQRARVPRPVAPPPAADAAVAHAPVVPLAPAAGGGPALEKCVDCGETTAPGALAQHRADACSHRLVPCRAGCGLLIQARSRNGHELSQCRLVMCSCGKMVLTQSLELHQQRECRNKSVQCRLGCGAAMAAHQRERHERHDCARRVASCPRCGAVKHASDLESHLATECDVQRANAAVATAMRTAFSVAAGSPSHARAPPPRLNAAAIRGPPVAPVPPSPSAAAASAAAAVAPVGSSDGSSSPEKQKIDALRERVLARRPPQLRPPPMPRPVDASAAASSSSSSPTAIGASSAIGAGAALAVAVPLPGQPADALKSMAASPTTRPPRRPLQPPPGPPPSHVDTSGMSPTRRKMLLGPQVGLVSATAAATAAAVPSPRPEEVAAAAAAAAARPSDDGETAFDGEQDMEDLDALVFSKPQ
ncbi:hypothetical protein ATCC90586_000973 [Pythium insidiosum]|nr:hypothetical protein ATCC90586_000973 [Pythium insidiosum]